MSFTNGISNALHDCLTRASVRAFIVFLPVVEVCFTKWRFFFIRKFHFRIDIVKSTSATSTEREINLLSHASLNACSSHRPALQSFRTAFCQSLIIKLQETSHNDVKTSSFSKSQEKLCDVLNCLCASVASIKANSPCSAGAGDSLCFQSKSNTWLST